MRMKTTLAILFLALLFGSCSGDSSKEEDAAKAAQDAVEEESDDGY